MARCPSCEVPADHPCRGEQLGNRKCGEVAYRKYFLRLALGRHEPPAGAEYFRNAAECPHREPIPPGERLGCGCSHRCAADPTHSPRPNGEITVLECWDCEIAPRLSWPEPPEEGGGG